MVAKGRPKGGRVGKGKEGGSGIQAGGAGRVCDSDSPLTSNGGVRKSRGRGEGEGQGRRGAAQTGVVSPRSDAVRSNGASPRVPQVGGDRGTRTAASPNKQRSVSAGRGQVMALPMLDSGPCWRDSDLGALRENLARDGYLLLRGVLPRAKVIAAREAAIRQLAAECPQHFVPGRD